MQVHRAVGSRLADTDRAAADTRAAVDIRAAELNKLRTRKYTFIDRKWDFMFWFTAAFVVAGAGDITRLLFAGDWDFWTDWKDRLWWMSITPFAAIIIPSALQYIQWRAWRFPGDGAPWPPPRRVYIVEVAFDADLAGTTAETQRRLAAAGEVCPQVEVYPTGLDEGELPSYQRLARGNGALLWARDPDPGIRVAELFDVFGEHGADMTPDHPTVPVDEVVLLLQYLCSGAPLLATTARMDDVLDPSRTGVVSMDLRTDGYWIWSEATVYYLRRYRLAPDPELLAHVRECGYRCVEVDGAAVHRALVVLREPATNEPTWVYSS